MRTPTHRRLARAAVATLAITAATGTMLAAAAPGLDLSVLGGANRNDGDQTREVRQSVVGGRARNVIL